MEIPVYNKDGVVAHTKVSEQDFNKVSKLRWNLDKKGYVVSSTKVRLHRFVLDAKKEDPLVDHINNDKLDNTRENLRFATGSQNAQNKAKIENGSSKYLGVSYCEERNKWICRIQINGKVTRYYFDNENHAAYCYDQMALMHHGELAKINNIDPPDVFVEPEEKVKRDLPIGVRLSKYGSYIAVYQNKYIGTYKTIEEAANAYNQTKMKQIKTVTEIKRNKEGIAVIVTSKNEEILVDDDKYADLAKYSWYIDSDGYAITNMNNKKVRMHRYLMNAGNEIVDHINNNPADNRISNLRISTNQLNAYNKSKVKNSSSQYFGVIFYKQTSRFLTRIKKDKKTYHIGYFKTEEEAAEAYNKKAIELYGKYANLNEITI